MTDLSGKTALVTGSTSGIGKATATALAARGAHVLIVGRNEQRAKDVVAEIEGNGGSATFLLTSLSDLKSAQDLVEWATEAGGGHVDILINNAGVALLGPSNAATEAQFDETFALNVKVPFFLVASLAPAMAERGWGSIVNVSTMVASFGQAGMAMYGASRAALELLTKTWAAEYGPSGVRVNAVCPRPDAHPHDGSGPRGDGESARSTRTSRSRRSSPRNLLRRSSFSPAMMPASSTASLLQSTGADQQRNACRRRRLRVKSQNTDHNNQLRRSINMSAYVIVEFTVKDPEIYREKYAPIAGQTAKEHGGEVLASGNWEVLHGDGSLTSGVLVRFADHETALRWYNSPEYQQLIEVRGIAMDARFSLLDGLPTPTEDAGGLRMSAAPGKDGAHYGRQRRDRQGGGPATGITS